MNIYVGNLSYDMTEQQLQNLFEDFGTVNSVKIITDRDTGNSKGFGFVEMDNSNEAESAIKELNVSEIQGRSIKVNESVPKNDRQNNRSW